MTIYIFYAFLVLVAAMSVLTFWGSLRSTNPYGRHMKPGQKGTMAALPAWLLFESPQLFAFAITFWMTVEILSAPALVLFALWQSHYIYRAIIYPLRMKDRGKQFPKSAVYFGIIFNSINGFINGFAVTHAPHLLADSWLTDPRFMIGFIVAACGWIINFQADTILINLRKDGTDGYKIPYGGMFRFVSSANYLGEIILWSGWAIMCFTPAGLIFALFTISNLLPRALAHHRWYHKTFESYPPNRKAIIPGLL